MKPKTKHPRSSGRSYKSKNQGSVQWIAESMHIFATMSDALFQRMNCAVSTDRNELLIVIVKIEF